MSRHPTADEEDLDSAAQFDPKDETCGVCKHGEARHGLAAATITPTWPCRDCRDCAFVGATRCIRQSYC
jgi:hypothetical protein